MTSEVIDATAVVVSEEPVSPALFGTTDPVEIVGKARDVANALKDVIQTQGLVSNIQGREYVRCEGWTLLGTMLGIFPVNVWTKQVEGGWEARVEARMRDGSVVGAAEAQCTRSENTWKNRDDYALRSMAQTRATSKALRMPLGFVVTLAGFQATPAEEMDFSTRSDRPVEAVPPPSCPEHGTKFMQLVKGGTSRNGKKYDAFWSCKRDCTNGVDFKGNPSGKGWTKDAAQHIADLQLARGEAPNPKTFDDLPNEVEEFRHQMRESMDR